MQNFSSLASQREGGTDGRTHVSCCKGKIDAVDEAFLFFYSLSCPHSILSYPVLHLDCLVQLQQSNGLKQIDSLSKRLLQAECREHKREQPIVELKNKHHQMNA